MRRFLFGHRHQQSLQYEYRNMPRASALNVVIKIEASSVNPHDWKYYDFLKPFYKLPLPLPRLALGHDISGTVVEVGKRVSDFKVGDEAFTRSAKTGAFGEYLSVNQWMVAKKPEALTHIEAATVPMAGLTAWQMFILTGLQAGDSVLLNGASGGVGIHALQIAKAKGAHVTAVCSSRNVELVESLGADAIIDYAQQDIHQLEQPFDVVFDAVGNISPFQCDHLVKEKGHFATTLPDWRTYLAILLSRLPLRSYLGLGKLRKTVTLLAMPIGKHLTYLRELVDKGELKAVVDKVYEITSLDDAFSYSKTGRARGKIALDVTGTNARE